MNATIHFCGSTVKQLEHLLRLAFQGGDLRVIKRISALLVIGDGQTVETAQAMGEFVPAQRSRTPSQIDRCPKTAPG
jgi:hypothetical protein